MLAKIHNNLKKYMILYVIVSIGLGWLLGYQYGHAVKHYQPTLKTLISVAVFLMIYPMMVNIRMSALVKALKNWKGLGLVLTYNFVWAPLFGYAMGRIFLHDPQLGFGFFMAMVVPCSSMSIGYTGLSEGNLELATVSVVTSFIVAIAAIPFWAKLLGGSFNVPVPMGLLLHTIIVVLILPMILGYLTRIALLRWLKEENFKKIVPLFASLTLIGMYMIVFLIFLMKANVLIKKWQLVALLFIPSTAFYLVTLALVTGISKLLGFSYEDHMGMVFASTGKNEGTAIAIATSAFSPLVAVPAAMMPIFQIVFLVGYLKLEGQVRKLFGAKPIEAERTMPHAKEVRSV